MPGRALFLSLIMYRDRLGFYPAEGTSAYVWEKSISGMKKYLEKIRRLVLLVLVPPLTHDVSYMFSKIIHEGKKTALSS